MFDSSAVPLSSRLSVVLARASPISTPQVPTSLFFILSFIDFYVCEKISW